MHDLKRLRLAANLTLEQASSGICSTSYLSLIEQGKREPGEKIYGALTERYANIGAGLTRAQINFYLDLEREILRRVPAARETVRNLAESNPVTVYLNGLVQEEEGNYTDAVAAYREALPNRLSRLFGLKAGIALIRMLKRTGEMVEAAVTFEVLHLSFHDDLELNPRLHVELDSNAVWPLMEIGSNSRALEIASEATSLAQSEKTLADCLALWSMADLAAQRLNYDEAARHLDEAIKIAVDFNERIMTYMLETQLARLQMEAGLIKPESVIDRIPTWRVDIDRNRLKYAENELSATEAAAYSLVGDVAALENAADSYLTWRKVFSDVQDLSGIESFVKAFLRVGNSARAKEFLALASEAASSKGQSYISARFWRNLAGYYEELGETSSAYECLKNMAISVQIPEGMHYGAGLLAEKALKA